MTVAVGAMVLRRNPDKIKIIPAAFEVNLQDMIKY